MEGRTVQEIALNNPIIFCKILQQTSTPLKNARLVCQFWNDIVLSLPNTRLELNLDDKYDDPSEAPFSFLALCFSLDDRLAKRISLTCDTAESDDPNDPTTCIHAFAYRLTHFCVRFTQTVQILELSIDDEDCLRYIHQVLTNCCPNLKQLLIRWEFSNHEEILFWQPLAPKPMLTSFVLKSAVETGIRTLTSFIQVVVNVAANLREVTLPWGIYPDFANCKSLDSLTIALDNLAPDNLTRVKDPEMARMLNAVSDQLVTLSFGEYEGILCLEGSGSWRRQEFRLLRRMSKLEKYRNLLMDVFGCDDILEKVPVLTTLVIGKSDMKRDSLHVFFQRIVDAERSFGSVRNLQILEMHDPKILEGLKTAFPNVVRFELATCSRRDDRGKKSGMKLDIVLKACGGWRGLKYATFSLPSYPDGVKDAIPALLGGRELYKGLKTLEIKIYARTMQQDLTRDELNSFKELLLVMNRIDEVIISYFRFSEKSERKILKLMESNNLTVSKFRIFQGKSISHGRD